MLPPVQRLRRPARTAAVAAVLGPIVAASALVLAPALVTALVLGEPAAPFAMASGLALVTGGLLGWPTRQARSGLRLRDALSVSMLAWVLVGVFCAIPMVLGAPGLAFMPALFESISGLTTTGASVITAIDGLPLSTLVLRQSLNFFGGMGIVVLAVTILPMLKVGGLQLFRTEATGPTDNKLTPRIRDTALSLWKIYLGLNVACALAYWIGGMSLLDAVLHAMATIGTGGFSPHDASFGFFDNATLDWIAIVFMLAGGTNFALHFLAWRRLSTNPYTQNSEWRSYLAIFAFVALGVALVLIAGGDFSHPGKALRHAAFQTASNLTSTGFTTTGFATWSAPAPLVLIFASFVGGMSGSTAGGIKVARVVMVVRQGLREIRQLVHPRGEFIVKMGGARVPGSLVLNVGGFCAIYAITALVVTVAFNLTGLDPLSAFGATAATLNNLGPGLGSVAVGFAEVGDPALAIAVTAMILGRLEIFGILVLLLPEFWRD